MAAAVVGSIVVVASAEYTNGNKERNDCIYQEVEENRRPTPPFS
jgi:hypothetical protein